MPTFVTGGSGYLGKQLVRRLANAGGKVHALVRKTSITKGLEHRNIELFYGDLEAPESIRAAMAGCQRVYHVGALVARWHPDPARFDAVNVAGSRNLFEAALELKVDKLVYTSSVMALGPSGDVPANETQPRPAGFVNDYERTKYLAEVEIRRYIDRGLPGLIVSPSLIYGPSLNAPGSLTNRFIKEFLDGTLKALPKAMERKANGVYIEDVVTGHLLAMDRGKVGEKYILGGENITLGGYLALMNSEFGLNRNFKEVPLPVVWLIGKFQEWRARVGGPEPKVTAGFARLYARDWAYSSNKARKELGYFPRPLRDGLKITHAWLTGKPLPPPPQSDLQGPSYIPISSLK